MQHKTIRGFSMNRLTRRSGAKTAGRHTALDAMMG
jgi:hypothetical protein